MNIRSLGSIVGFLLFSVGASAGTWTSGGGNAVVCTDRQGRITSAELLDLYEARAMYGLVPVPSSAPMREQAIEAAKRIDAGFERSAPIADLIGRFEEKLRFLPKGTGLKPVEDSNHIVFPKSCQIVQLARYESDDLIYIDSDIWDFLNELNRAALLLHEILYWELRVYGESTSDRARKAVANAFAHIDFPAVESGILSDAEECVVKFDKQNEIPWAVFASYRDPEYPDGVVLQFLFLSGKPVLSKSIVKLVGTKWPLATTPDDNFIFAKVESLTDSGSGIYIRTTPNVPGQTGLIGPAGGLKMPTMPFVCRQKPNP